MSIYAHIKRCLELSERDIALAVAEKRVAKALVDQLAKVSKPGDGAPKLLLLFAKIAASGVEWMDGALHLELVSDGDKTAVDVLSELGMGMRERVFPSFKMSVPLEEFARAVERVPHMIAPLSIVATSGTRLVLTASDEEVEDASSDEESSGAVPIADESMYTAEKRTSSRDKMQAVRGTSPKMGAGRKSSRPQMAATKPGTVPPPEPKVIASRSGKTLRPGAPPPAVPRGAPLVVPKAPSPPRGERAAAAASEPKRAVVARVPLNRIQVPRGSTGAPTPKSPPAPRRSSNPAGKRVSVKPAPLPSKGTRASKSPPPREPSVRPPKPKRGHATSEPPDEESIDTGWDDDK
jgi:hypothetical protein